MSLSAAILTSLSFSFGKFLLKKWLQDDGVDAAAETLAEIGTSKLQNLIDRKAAARSADAWADKVVEDLIDTLEDEKQQHPELDIEGIGRELATTLEQETAPEFFLAGDLDYRKVAQEYRDRRPLPKGCLDLQSDLAYERCLEHAVKSLVSVIPSLPTFQEKAIAESLRRLRDIEDVMEKVLASNRRIEREVKRNSSVGEEDQFEIEYRQAVATNLDYIELFGITIRRELKRFQLTDAFVSLNLQRSTKKLGKLKHRKADEPEEDDSESLNYEAALDQLREGDNLLLIRGAAGSGKTTLIRKIAIEAANLGHRRVRLGFVNRYIEIALTGLQRQKSREEDSGEDSTFQEVDFTDTWREKVPFVVLLRHCRDGQLPKAEEFAGLIGEGIGTPPKDWVRNILKAGRGLVMIDGVDEVPPDRRDGVIKWLDKLVKHYPTSFFIVTTRPEAVPDNWLAEQGFREALVNPMGNADIEQFIRRWHQLAEQNLAAAGEPQDLSDKRQRLMEQLDQNPALRPLSTYPLLCGSICALHLNGSGTLPESQSALCDAMCDSLLHERERAQKEDFDLASFPAAYRELTIDQKRTLIQDLAVYMVEEGRSALTHTEAEDRIAKKLAGFRDRTADDAQVVLRGLLERSGVLREPVPEEVDFLHNTFKEFLAGEYFAAERSIGKLLQHVFSAGDGAESWRRVTLFAAGSRRAPESFGRDLIQQLLSDSTPPKETGGKRRSKKDVLSDPVRQRHLLALQCQVVADGKGLSPELKAQLQELVGELFPPRTLSDAESLAVLRDQAVPYLTRSSRKRQTIKDDLHCVRALRLINTPAARRALEEYMDTTSWRVIEELSLAIDPLRIAAVRQAFLDSADLPEGVRNRVQDLDCLIHLTPAEDLRAAMTLNLRGTQVSDVSPLKKLQALQTLYLRGTPVSDVSSLKDLHELQNLNLFGTQVSDVSPLKDLQALHTLDLTGTQVSDVSPLKSLRAIRVLHLGRTQVSDVTSLKDLQSLETLHLYRTPVSDVGPLKDLHALQILSLSDTLLRDVSPLKDLRMIQELYLYGTQVSDVSPLKDLQALQALYLNETQVSDVSPLKDLQALQMLYLDGTQVSDVSPLKDLQALQTLSLHGTQVSDVSPLAGIQGLGIYGL